MSIRGAVFDADGTLLDSMGIWDQLGGRYLESLGVPAEQDLGKRLAPMSMEEGSAYLKDHYSLSEAEEEIRAGLTGILSDFYTYEVQGKPGINGFLKKLKARDIPMVIATTGDKDLLEAALRRLNLYGYFERIFTCTELHTTKRSPVIYQAAAGFLGTAPGETAVFEDVLWALRAAKQGGFFTVGIKEGANGEVRTEADFYLEDFLDFDGFWSYASGR